jgi:hypothetical protein
MFYGGIRINRVIMRRGWMYFKEKKMDSIISSENLG